MGGVPPENYSKAKMVKCSDFVMCFYSYDVVSRNRRAKLLSNNQNIAGEEQINQDGWRILVALKKATTTSIEK